MSSVFHCVTKHCPSTLERLNGFGVCLLSITCLQPTKINICHSTLQHDADGFIHLLKSSLYNVGKCQRSVNRWP